MMDHEFVNQQQELLSIYRRNLAIYLNQLAIMGFVNAPPSLIYGIVEARQNIRSIKQSLCQQGIEVEDIATDEDEETTAVAPYGNVDNQRVLTYKKFWSMVEEIHISVRTHPLDKDYFDKAIQELNTFAIRRSLDIDPGDQILANNYLKTLFKLRTLVEIEGSEQEKKGMATTGYLRADQFQLSKQLVFRLDNLRNALYGRVKSIVNASSYTAESEQSYCPHCGHKVKPLTRYCGHCGHEHRHIVK